MTRFKIKLKKLLSIFTKNNNQIKEELYGISTVKCEYNYDICRVIVSIDNESKRYCSIHEIKRTILLSLLTYQIIISIFAMSEHTIQIIDILLAIPVSFAIALVIPLLIPFDLVYPYKIALKQDGKIVYLDKNTTSKILKNEYSIKEVDKAISKYKLEHILE